MSKTGDAAFKVLTVAVVALLIMSAYLVIEVSTLQGQVSSLQNQNDNLQIQLTNVEQAENYLYHQIQSLFTTSGTAKSLSFEILYSCVGAAPVCYTSLGQQGRYVYAFTVYNNGTETIPVTSSVYLSFKDSTSGATFAFNTSLPASIPPETGVGVNATSWPAYVNGPSMLQPGDTLAIGFFIEDQGFLVMTHVVVCSASTTTFTNATLTTATWTTCA